MTGDVAWCFRRSLRQALLITANFSLSLKKKLVLCTCVGCCSVSLSVLRFLPCYRCMFLCGWLAVDEGGEVFPCWFVVVAVCPSCVGSSMLRGYGFAQKQSTASAKRASSVV